ncbi:MAG: hypothetical protein KC912_08500 [Proteobacteria bacterium]|nr:hypothetical protein [Pseudomonadota bacterium]
MLTLFSLVGCADGLVCGEGTAEANGECIALDTGEVPGDDPAVLDLLDALPDCVAASTDGSIDLVAGCVGTGCIGDTLAELDAAYGETANCTTYSSLFSNVFCDWSNGVSTSFADEDEDGEVDVGAVAGSLSVDAPYAGGTTTGLGIDANMRCFVDVLGMPDTVEYAEKADGTYGLRSMNYYDEGLFVDDLWNGANYEPDGSVDGLFIMGPAE